MTSLPLINTGRDLGGPSRITQAILLPADSPLGNLFLKYSGILDMLHHANGRIVVVAEMHRIAVSDPMTGSTVLGILHHTQEEVVYWLRRCADELACLDVVIAQWNATGQCPTKVKPDCIGHLVDDAKALAPFKQCEAFLRTLNEVSNAYKHSFINAQLTLLGADQPRVFAYALGRNNLKNQPQFYEVNLADVIEGFNVFFGLVKDRLKASTLQHLVQQESEPAA